MKILALVLACASAAMAGTVTLTMDEVPFQPINGLAVTKGGITFTFSDPGGQMLYKASNGGNLTYVQDPTIEGLNDTFSVAFSVPVSSVQFGMAASSFTPVTIATVTFYNGATQIATMTLHSSLTDPFAEGQLTFSSPTITSMTIAPPAGATFPAFALDNLTVTTAASTVPDSSPLTLALMTIGIVGLGGLALRKKPGSAA